MRLALAEALLIFGLSLGAGGGLAARPSAAKLGFDCAKAGNAVERKICAEPILVQLEIRLTRLYREATETQPPQLARLRRDQLTWLHDRDQSCAVGPDMAPCIDGYYRNRLDALRAELHERDLSIGHAAASGRYGDFVGLWRVVGVTGAPDAGEVVDFSEDDPQYVGLELSANGGFLRWRNGSRDTGTQVACEGPSFAPRSVKTPLRAGWKAVILHCRDGDWDKDEGAFTLKNADLAELEWEDGALLTLARVRPGDLAPPTPHTAPPIPNDSSYTSQLSVADKAFFTAFQIAVRQGDRAWLATHSFPDLSVLRAKGASHTYSPDEILEAYDWIITPDIRGIILAQKPDDLFKRDMGVMVGNGQVWFDKTLKGETWVYGIRSIIQNAPKP